MVLEKVDISTSFNNGAFESSANFVEEQEKGVFPKTLRNMWIIVSVLNPLMAFFALSLVPIHEVKELYENMSYNSHSSDIKLQ